MKKYDPCTVIKKITIKTIWEPKKTSNVLDIHMYYPTNKSLCHDIDSRISFLQVTNMRCLISSWVYG